MYEVRSLKSLCMAYLQKNIYRWPQDFEWHVILPYELSTELLQPFGGKMPPVPVSEESLDHKVVRQPNQAKPINSPLCRTWRPYYQRFVQPILQSRPKNSNTRFAVQEMCSGRQVFNEADELYQ